MDIALRHCDVLKTQGLITTFYFCSYSTICFGATWIIHESTWARFLQPFQISFDAQSESSIKLRSQYTALCFPMEVPYVGLVLTSLMIVFTCSSTIHYTLHDDDVVVYHKTMCVCVCWLYVVKFVVLNVHDIISQSCDHDVSQRQWYLTSLQSLKVYIVVCTCNVT